jgi:hypothetical protein
MIGMISLANDTVVVQSTGVGPTLSFEQEMNKTPTRNRLLKR